MATPKPATGGPEPSADPTVRVQRPVRSPTDQPAAAPPRPGHPDDESTVDLPRPTPDVRQRTIEFGTPAPVRVTVTARPRPRRRLRTWPWIVAVVLALLAVGTVLLVMLLRGATVEGRVGSPVPAPSATESPAPGGWGAA